MGTVSLAAIKLGGILMGWPGWLTLAITGVITLSYSALGGLRAVILTDLVQFVLAMIGSIWACVYILDLEAIGGLSNLLAHAEVSTKTAMLPDLHDASQWVPILAGSACGSMVGELLPWSRTWRWRIHCTAHVQR